MNSYEYLVLESINTSASKVIHVMNFAETYKMVIGRGQGVDLRVSDISVSRKHAIFVKGNNSSFYLVDNHSKFGTFALVRSPIELKPSVNNSKVQL